MPQPLDEFILWFTLATLGAMAMLFLLLAARLIMNIGNPQQVPQKADPRFPDREPLSLDEFYTEYYSAHQFPRTIVLDVLTRFAAAVRVSAAVLHPEDSFNTLAEVVKIDTEACEQLAVETASSIHEAEAKYGANLFSGRLNTLDDYIRTTVLAHRLMTGK